MFKKKDSIEKLFKLKNIIVVFLFAILFLNVFTFYSSDALAKEDKDYKVDKSIESKIKHEDS